MTAENANVVDEVRSYGYICIRDCPCSMSPDENGKPNARSVQLYRAIRGGDEEGPVIIKSTLHPSLVPHHFECTDPEVEKMRKEVFAERAAAKKVKDQEFADAQLRESAPVLAVTKLADSITEALRGAQQAPPAAPVVPEAVVTEPAAESSQGDDSPGDNADDADLTATRIRFVGGEDNEDDED